MIGLLLSLYPARWRRRYGEEFRAVLESRPLGPFDVADVLLGALDARLTPLRLPGSASGGHIVLLRIGGLGAILGGPAWFAGLAVSSGVAAAEGGRPWLGVMAVGSIGLLIALIGLSAFQGHRQPVLSWIAFAVPAIANLLAAVGALAMLVLPEDAALFGMWSPWGIWFIGILGLLVGSMLFAGATYRADVLSRRAAASLGAGSAAAILLAMATAADNPGEYGWILLLVAMASFAGSWMWLGMSALRRGPITSVAPA